MYSKYMENILTIYLPEIITIITILFIGYTTKQQICYILSILFILFILYFNRDFKGSFDKSDKTIIIPADGKITQIINFKEIATNSFLIFTEINFYISSIFFNFEIFII